MNGNESGRLAQNAREMTAEIDRVTEEEVAKLEKHEQQELGRQRAGSLGGQILTYNPDQKAAIRQEQSVIQSNENVRRQAERDEGYIEAARHNTGINGAETGVQAQEWVAEDKEDIANESGLNGRYVKNLMDRNNKRITKETVAAVDKMIADNEYHPSKLDRMATSARTTFLKDVFNRILGSRN